LRLGATATARQGKEGDPLPPTQQRGYMSRNVTFKFDIGDSVKILAINVSGRVDAQMTTTCGTEYRVIYWYNGERKAVWMYDYELEFIKEKESGV